MPRPVTLLSVLILGGAGVAAVDAQSPYALPETPVSAGAFSLPKTSKCVASPYVVVLKVAPPAGAAFDDLEVRVDERLSTTVSGATTESRHQVYVGPGTSEVVVEATTPGGQSASLSRTYRSCAKPRRKAPRKRPSTGGTTKPKPIPAPGSPITQGGGED